MIYAPVLAFPDFTKDFIVITNASGNGMMQEKHPIV